MGCGVSSNNADAVLVKVPPGFIIEAASLGLDEDLSNAIRCNPQSVKLIQYGFVALEKAIENGHLQTAKLLLNAGVNPNYVGQHGMTLLMEYGAIPGRSDVIRLLIGSGKADLNIAGMGGFTPLMR